MASRKSDLTVDLIARDRMTQPIKNIQSSIIRFVGAVSAALAAIRVVAFPIQQALEFDRAMRDVQKTTGFTDNQINKLSADLNKLSTTLSVSQQELAAIAAVGGQLGLGAEGVEAIRDFTESVARAQVTLGLTADAAAELGAQLLNIFGVDISRIENVFSLINELTNNSVANAADLGDIMKRVGNIAGLTIEQVGALAAFARDLGITAEVAGTSYSKFFTNISTQAEGFAKVMKITTEEWLGLVERDAVNALFSAAKAINELDTAAQSTAIKELFGGGRLFSFGSKIVQAASNDFARFNQLLGLSTTAFIEGTSSVKEYENILKSVKEQFIVVGNAVRGLAIEVGVTLLPDLEKLATSLREFLTGEVGRDLFLELGKAFKDAAVFIEEMVTELVESNVEWGKIVDTIGYVVAAFGVLLGLGLIKHIALLILWWVRLGRSLVKNTGFIQFNTQAYMRNALAARTAGTTAAAAINLATLSLRRHSIAVVQANGAWSTLGKTITGGLRILGRGITGFLGGIPGLILIAATAVFGFWDDITALFSSGSEKLTETAQRKMRADLRKLKEEAQELAGVFESAINRPGFREVANNTATPEQRASFAGVDPTEALRAGSLDDYSKAVSDLSERYVMLEKAVRGADVVLASFQGQIVKNGVALNGVREGIEKYEKELANLEKYQEQQDAYSNQLNETNTKLAQTRNILDSLNKEQEVRVRLQKELNELQEAAERQRANLAAEFDTTADRLVSNKVITQETVKVLAAQREVLNIEQQVVEKKREQERLEGLLEQTTAGVGRSAAARRKSETEYTRQIALSKAEMQELGIKLAAANKNAIELKGNLALPQLELVTDFEQAKSIGLYDNFLQSLGRTKEEIPTQEELNNLFRERIVELAKNRAEAEALLEKYRQYKKPIDDALKAVDGMFDNIEKTTRKTTRELEKLKFTLDEIIAKRKQERDITKGQDKVDKDLAKKEEQINKKYDNLIKREIAFAQSSGRAVSTEYLEKLEKRREKELEAAKATAETKKEELEVEVVRDNSAKSLAEYIGLMTRYTEVVDQIGKLSKDRELLKTPEGAEQFKNLTNEFRELQAEIGSSEKAAISFAKELADLDAEVPRYPGDTKGKLLVSDEEIQVFGQSIAETTARFNELQKTGIEALNAASEGISSFVSGTEATLSSAIKDADNALGQFIKTLPKEAGEAIESLVRQFSEAFKALPQGYLEAKSVIENNGISIATNLQEIGEALAGQNLYDEITRIAGETAAESLQLVVTNAMSQIDLTIPESAIDAALRKAEADAKGKQVKAEGVLDFDPTTLRNSLQGALNGINEPFSLPVKINITNEEDLRRALGVPGASTGGYFEGNTLKFSKGGSVWGAGTSTSDSIMARLSRGEFVMKAAAVKKYGVNFLYKLNRMLLPKVDLPKFAIGGFVNNIPAPNVSVPAFANGGVVTEVINRTMESSTVPTERVQVDIISGGQTTTLFGEREQVRNFVSTMKRLGKGS
jgi:TP901 family phage tail tape measure protein